MSALGGIIHGDHMFGIPETQQLVEMNRFDQQFLISHSIHLRYILATFNQKKQPFM